VSDFAPPTRKKLETALQKLRPADKTSTYTTYVNNISPIFVDVSEIRGLHMIKGTAVKQYLSGLLHTNWWVITTGN